LLQHVGDLFELNVKLRCQKVKIVVGNTAHSYSMPTVRNRIVFVKRNQRDFIISLKCR